MLGHGATGQFAIGQVGAGAAETITLDKWFVALSEPVRRLPGLLTAQQQAAFPDPFPFVSFSWFNELSKPASLKRPALNAGEVQFIAFDPLPRVSFSWFEALSEPVRKLPGLPPPLQQFFTTDTSVIPLSKLIEWFMALSEPVRKLAGLDAARQQFLATPSRLIPTPTTIGTLSALETKDTFLGGATEWNRVISGEMGVVGPAAPSAGIGVAIPTVASASISVRIV